MLGRLLLASFLAPAASEPCIFPTKYAGGSVDGCMKSTSGKHRAWCYVNDDGGWRNCDGTDNACEFPFSYDKKDYMECTTADHDQPWCYKVGGGWRNCAPQVDAGMIGKSGGFGTHEGAAGWVADHNYFRAMHGASKVEWDSDLEKKAQTWADNMHNSNSMYHSNSYDMWPPSGENLAFGYGGSCSAAEQEGGPRLYTGPYDQHCVVASWYGEYYLWRGSGNWQSVGGLGHFTAMVWKGVDTIGCAASGRYYVCEYGSKHCKGHEQLGGMSCWGTSPPHLPNFNQDKCAGGACVESLFEQGGADVALEGEPSSGVTWMLAAAAAIGMLAAGAPLVARRFRAPAPRVLLHDGDESSPPGLQQDGDESSNPFISA